jgi:tetratricopeptide (TPR) repeat protein
MSGLLSRRGRIAGCALAALTAVACAPSARTLRREVAAGAPGRAIESVPFVRQRRNWCGPAALTSVVRYYGLPLTQEEVARDVFLPSIDATLTIDLQRCAQDHGLWCHAGQGSIEEVCTWLDRGVPVIALLRVGWLVATTRHYVVLTGYHGGRRYFLAHTGDAADRVISFARFARQHAAAGRWFLALARPEQVRWPLTADGYNDLALLLERQGKPGEARSHTERAVALNPNKAVFQFNLGNSLVRGRDLEGARAAFRRAIELEQDFADAHNNLAHVLLGLGPSHAEEARQEAARAVELGGPRVAYYHDTLGRCLLDLRRPPEAVGAFRAAIQAAGQDRATAEEARLGLIEALHRADRSQEARAEREALLRSTSDPAIRRRAQQLME